MRFWLSQDSHPSRHIMGWHRLLLECRKHSVKVVAVFDGPMRSPAKEAEAKRREDYRRIIKLRALMEEERSKRLSQLYSTVEHLEPEQVEENRIPEAEGPPNGEDFVDNARTTPSAGGDEKAGLLRKLAELYHDWHQGRKLQHTEAANSSLSEEPGGSFAPSLLMGSETRKPADPSNAIPTSLPEHLGGVPASKLQNRIEVEEVILWRALLDKYGAQLEQEIPGSPPTAADATELLESSIQRARRLAGESTELYQSYLRRQDLPMPEVYQQVRMYLRIFKVPIVVASYPFEAEGVAASLCLHGLADYVGSEDTVCLDPPLPRLVLTRSGLPGRHRLRSSAIAQLDIE